ncbi:TlpA family protein disulfide reductase [Sinomicrobium kalidii]|uniref:TlpA disulfide reductase family protein n=1 Tax=Sinomicrobium kalidii TaxID=2900738 RepID=UPI001E4EB2F0|nr:TlpA disulfide reductase family protein [Sinomicrobium kalidii]UGU15398.1 TlpA family protein disulfide reductase [Sinomicrobium kalidii]
MKFNIQNMLSGVLFLCTLITTPAQEHRELSLSVGDPAPAIDQLQWVKGRPVTGFKKGQIYVVELTSVACPFCRESMPYLKELVQKYEKKIKLLAIYLEKKKAFRGSSPEYPRKVKDYVTVLNNPYPVAVDDSTGTVYRAWMKPAGLMGVPQALVVGQDGRITWIGHPMELAPVIAQLTSGTFAPEVEYCRQTRALQKLKQVMHLQEAGKWNRAYKVLDQLISEYPEKRYFLYPRKYETLLKDNPEKAYRFIGRFLKEKQGYSTWKGMAETLLFYSYKNTLTAPHYDQLITLAQKAIAQTTDKLHKVQNLRMQAYAYAQKEDYAKAVEIQQEVIRIQASRAPRDVFGEGTAYDRKKLEQYREFIK